MLVRFFAPAALLAAAVVGLGLCQTEAALLLTATGAGMCSGWLYYHSATVQGTVGDGQIKYQYIAIPCANIACALVFTFTHFKVDASQKEFQVLCNVQAAMLVAFLIPATILHATGAIDYSALFGGNREPDRQQGEERAPLCEFTPEGASTPRPTVSDGSEYLQFFSSMICFLPIPLLPLVVSAEMSHKLMQLRLYAEAVGVLFLLAQPIMSFAARALFLALRVVILGLLVYYGRQWSTDNQMMLFWVWSAYMASGITLGGLNDCAAKGSAVEVKTFLRRIRVAHYGGMLLGVVLTGAFAFGYYAHDAGPATEAEALISLRRMDVIVASAMQAR